MIGFSTSVPSTVPRSSSTESENPLPVTTARDLVTNLPRASLALIPGAGHLPFLETPDHFFTLVETFLAGL
jgi:pimeloyl-ACP methyl ester carboxylesterase